MNRTDLITEINSQLSFLNDYYSYDLDVISLKTTWKSLNNGSKLSDNQLWDIYERVEDIKLSHEWGYR
ncbi:hypothetical protein LABALGNA3A7_05390 [Dellaglioa algida]|nr:hypothetical protein LABALGNA3A7_05390 [Dellaglioa algida]